MIGAILGNGLYGKTVFGMKNGGNAAEKPDSAPNVVGADGNTAENAKRDLINRNYNDIYTHELAHKTAGGNLAGAIVIEYNDEGIPVAGHVNIRMPVLNQSNPEATIKDADTVIRSATAPSDPSEQDYKVAAEAKEIKARAENLKTKQRLDIVA